MQGPSYPAPPPPKKGMSTLTIVLIVLAVTIVPALGIMSVLSIYGVRKYIANAKTAEAKNSLGVIGQLAVAAYEESHRICPSASAPIPAARKAVSGMKYQSAGGEWEADTDKNAGFACLKFALGQPQYFQYEYEATETSFVARAHGDLNGDGVFSTFELRGEIQSGHLLVSPTIRETNPGE